MMLADQFQQRTVETTLSSFSSRIPLTTPSGPQWTESELEAELVEQIAFSPGVYDIITQPIILYPGPDGKERRYTPDIAVQLYASGDDPANRYIIEVKRSADLEANRHKYKGNYPDVGKPLEAVQIDHWKADIEILSEDRLTVVGRVWTTLAIDIYSRMVYGMHVGFDAPSTTTLGLAMINGMLRKDAIAERYGLEWDNPIYGPLERLEADNAKEFRGASAQKSAEHFNIRLKWRPLGAPQYGGHIERLMGINRIRSDERKKVNYLGRLECVKTVQLAFDLSRPNAQKSSLVSHLYQVPWALTQRRGFPKWL